MLLPVWEMCNQTVNVIIILSLWLQKFEKKPFASPHPPMFLFEPNYIFNSHYRRQSKHSLKQTPRWGKGKLDSGFPKWRGAASLHPTARLPSGSGGIASRGKRRGSAEPGLKHQFDFPKGSLLPLTCSATKLIFKHRDFCRKLRD